MFQDSWSSVTSLLNQDYVRDCGVADSNEFMTKLLPVPNNVIRSVRKEMETKGVYANSRWVAFPEVDDNPMEEAVYKAFITVANAIHNAALSTTNYPEEDLRYLRHCMWIDNQAKVSLSEERNGKYPDASLVLDPLVRQTWELDASKPELSVSPLQVIAVVGVKSFKARDGTAPTKQVIGFLLRSLSEQLDRRFILGFIVQQSHIVVLIHDRSGVLVTERSLGIYEDPDFFIRLISAFAVLTADKLGFNPTMKP